MLFPALIFCMSLNAQNTISEKELLGKWSWAATESSDPFLLEMMKPYSFVFEFTEGQKATQSVYIGKEFMVSLDADIRLLSLGKIIEITPHDSANPDPLKYQVELYDGNQLVLGELNAEGKVSLYYTFIRSGSLGSCSAVDMRPGLTYFSKDDAYVFRVQNAWDTAYTFRNDTLFAKHNGVHWTAALTLRNDSVFTHPAFYSSYPPTFCGIIRGDKITREDQIQPMGFWRATGSCKSALLAGLASAGAVPIKQD